MAYKTFVNGSPLPASDLNTFLMNQSVIRFASAAARDAVLTDPTEGMVVYLNNDNKLYLYTGAAWELQNPITTRGDFIVGAVGGVPSRLGIGTNNQVLTSNGTTAVWTNPVSGGLVEISSTALTGASVVIGSIPATYKQLHLEIRSANLTINPLISMRVNADTGNNYARTQYEFTNSTVSMTNAIFIGEHDIAKGAIFSSFIHFTNYSSNAAAKIINTIPFGGFTTSAASRRLEAGISAWQNSAAINSITLYPSTGAWNAGTAILWGVN